MKWITRERPKIDRLACPWLIKNFIDPDAEFIYVPYEEVLSRAEEQNATPFDIPGVEYTHYGERSTFDYILKKHQLTDNALLIIAKIVRGADTDRHDIAPEAAGLWAISAGLAHNIRDDYRLLDIGFTLYDALYSWASHLYKKKHLENSPFENLLHEVYQKLLQADVRKRQNPPLWVKELKGIIQDQIDMQMIFDQKQISHELDINPSYLSREFSRYFDNMSFGEYVRKSRIDKAIALMENPQYTLTEIAYLTGFSDQSHFTRVFRQQTGLTPSSYRKNGSVSKRDTKGK
jgi:AraC-like DNA-binding protein